MFVVGFVGAVIVDNVQMSDGSVSDGSEASRCIRVSPEVVSAIEEGLVGGSSLRFTRAVRSDDFEQVYFVGADIDGPGVNRGAWATNRIDGLGGLFFSVNDVALYLSDWGDGAPTPSSRCPTTVPRKRRSALAGSAGTRSGEGG